MNEQSRKRAEAAIVDINNGMAFTTAATKHKVGQNTIRKIQAGKENTPWPAKRKAGRPLGSTTKPTVTVHTLSSTPRKVASPSRYQQPASGYVLLVPTSQLTVVLGSLR